MWPGFVSLLLSGPRRGQGQRRRVDPGHDLAQHAAHRWLADPEMTGTLDTDDLCLGDRLEAESRGVRAKVVVMLGHKRDDGLAARSPRRQMLRPAPPQRWAEQDDPVDGRVKAVHEGQVRPERPAEKPATGQHRPLVELGELDRGSDVIPFGLREVERALRGSPGGGGSACVEPEDRKIGHRRQAVSGLLEDVAVHEATMGGQRMQRHQRRDRVTVGRYSELADERQTVSGVQLDIVAASREDRAGPHLVARPGHR